MRGFLSQPKGDPEPDPGGLGGEAGRKAFPMQGLLGKHFTLCRAPGQPPAAAGDRSGRALGGLKFCRTAPTGWPELSEFPAGWGQRPCTRSLLRARTRGTEKGFSPVCYPRGEDTRRGAAHSKRPGTLKQTVGAGKGPQATAVCSPQAFPLSESGFQ